MQYKNRPYPALRIANTTVVSKRQNEHFDPQSSTLNEQKKRKPQKTQN